MDKIKMAKHNNKDYKYIRIPIPVILGSYVNAIGLIRSFAAKKIPTICLDSEKGLAGYSRFTKFDFCPNPTKNTDDFIDYLITVGKTLPFKGVLFATSDEWLIPILKREDVLKKYFIFPMSGWDVIETAIDKQKMYKVADEANIPIPKTFFLNDIAEIQSIRSCIEFPAILKPTITVNFEGKLPFAGRNLIVENETDLNYFCNMLIKKGLDKIPIVIQEYIPNTFGCLYTITSYANKESDITAYSTGYKIGQYPSAAGTITWGFVKDEPEVYRLASQLIKDFKYYGISNIEFKYDHRDKIFKLMEINPRPGKWNYSVYASGLNLPWIAYMEALHEEFDHEMKGRDNIIWIHLRNVLASFVVEYKGGTGNKRSAPSLVWIMRALLKAKIVLAVESLRDPVPMLYEWGSWIYRGARR